MSDEQIRDEAVSSTYRQLPAQSSPAHLDDAVLRMAAKHAQHARYARSITWTRPLAWAATIVLCLAITFQVTRFPPQDVTPMADVAHAPVETAAQPTSPPPRQKLESDESRDAELADAAQTAGREEAKRADQPAAASKVFALPTSEGELLQQAEEIVRLQNGSNIEPAMQEAARRSFASEQVSAPCPDEARADPDSWLKCIEALEEIGASEAAALERESLLEVFPDFKLP